MCSAELLVASGAISSDIAVEESYFWRMPTSLGEPKMASTDGRRSGCNTTMAADESYDRLRTMRIA
jgi:hypothetical protein